MAAAEKTETFDCSVEDFFKIIADYEKYHEFLPEVKKCTVIKEEKGFKFVEYQVSVMKSFKYLLKMKEVKNKEITWEFVSGDLFKTSVGSWKLKDVKGKCSATYAVDATFNMMVPGPIAKALVSVNLPNMMKAYHARIKELVG